MKKFNFKAADMGQDHVYILFVDGEIGMTKGGDLFGSRNLHQMKGAILPQSLVIDLPVSVLDQFTETYNGFKCIFLNEEEESDEYRAWLLSDGISPATLQMMKERLKRVKWLRDRKPDEPELTIEMITRAYSGFIDNQTTIHSYLWEQHREAVSNGETPRIEYLTDCIEGEFDDQSWDMLNTGRAMRDAWHSLDCDEWYVKRYLQDNWDRLYRLAMLLSYDCKRPTTVM